MSEAITSAPLGQNINVLSGFAFPSAGFNQLVGLPLIRIRDLGRAQAEVRFSGQYDPAYLIQNGDILIGMDGDFEVHRWSGDVALLNQRVCKVEAATRQVDQSFLYWHLKPRVAEVHRRTPQTTVRHLSARDLYLIPMPPIPALEQVVVAKVLDTLDTAIHETEAIIAKLKTVKQGLLHDLLTRGIDANGELRPPQSEAPHLYKPSPLGWIPKEWEISSVGSEYEIQLGKMLDSERNVGVLKPYLGNKAVQWDRIDTSEVQYMRFSKSDLLRFRLRHGDLLVCEGGEVGRSAIWEDQLDECYYQKALHRLRPIKRHRPRLMLELLRYLMSKDALSEYVSKTSIAHLTQENLAAVPLPVPGDDEQDQIIAVLAAAKHREEAEVASLRNLRLLKAGLMDDLLTGRVRVTPLLQEAQHA